MGADRDLVAEESVEGGNALAFDGVEPGEYTVQAWMLAGESPPVRVHEQTLVVGAGKTSELEIDLRGFEVVAPLAALDVIVDASAVHDFRPYRLRLQRTAPEPSEPLERGLDSLRRSGESLWLRLDSVLPGEYQASITPGGSTRTFEVRSSGRVEHEIDFAPAPEVVVHGVSSANGESVPPDTLFWRPCGDGATAGAWRVAAPVISNGVGRIAVDHGWVEIGVHVPGARTVRRKLLVDAPRVEELFELTPVVEHELELSLACEGEEVLAPSSFWSSVRITDATGSEDVLHVRLPTRSGALGHWTETSSGVLVVGSTGPHTLFVPQLPGYEALERRIEVGRDIRELVLELSRHSPMEPR